MAFPFFFKPKTVECASCRAKFPTVGQLKSGETFVCSMCHQRYNIEKAMFTPASFDLVQAWTKIDSLCHCGTAQWSMIMRLKKPWEFETAGKEPMVIAAGKEVELTECPNPDCDSGWGNLPHHDIITERFPFMTPPWARTKESKMVGPRKYEEAQREHNREWFDQVDFMNKRDK